MELCKVCDKEYKKITGTHVKTHGMTVQQYEDYESEMGETDEEETVVENNVIMTPEQRKKNIFNIEDLDATQPLQNFLDEFEISHEDLIKAAIKWGDRDALYVKEKIEQDVAMGAKKASVIASSKGKIQFAYDVHTAEDLVDNHGFKVEEVRSQPKKTWVLSR